MSESQWTIDKVRSFFINPRSGSDTVKLALKVAHVTLAVGAIYSHGDEPNVLDRVMGEIGGDELGKVIEEMLRREASTRKFDHKFMGQIHPHGNEVAVLAKLVGGLMNTNTIVREVSSAEHDMEFEVLDWLAEMMGYDKGRYSGNLTVGGTTANINALWVARERLIKDLKTTGQYRRGQRMAIIASDMKHYSIAKASSLLGDNVLFCESKTTGFSTDVTEMERVIKNCQRKRIKVIAIVGLAGETETGMIDDLDAIADLAQEYGVYYHVDAAYGGPYKLVIPEMFNGINRADSITLDPHKLFYTPYPCAAVLFKNKQDHALVQNKNRNRYVGMKKRAGILGPRLERDLGLAARVEGSMGPDSALMAWATMQLFGEAGYRVLLQHTIDLTKTAYEAVMKSQILRPLHEPHTNSLLLGLVNWKRSFEECEKFMHTVRDELEHKHGYYVSVNEDIDSGCPAFRTVYMNPWTYREDVLDMIFKLEQEILLQYGRN